MKILSRVLVGATVDNVEDIMGASLAPYDIYVSPIGEVPRASIPARWPVVRSSITQGDGWGLVGFRFSVTAPFVEPAITYDPAQATCKISITLCYFDHVKGKAA